MPASTSIQNLQWISDSYLLARVRMKVRHDSIRSGFQYSGRTLLLDLRNNEQSVLLPNQPHFHQVTPLEPFEAGAALAHVRTLNLRPAADHSRTNNWAYFTASLYRLDLGSGQHTKIEVPDNARYQVFTSSTGTPLAWLNVSAESGSFQLSSAKGQHLEGANATEIRPAIIAETVDVPGLLLSFDGGPHQGFRRLNLATGAIESIALLDVNHDDAPPIVDQWRQTWVGWTDRSDGLRRSVFSDGELRATAERLDKLLVQQFGPGQTQLSSWSTDRAVVSGAFTRLGRPPEYFVFIRSSSELKLLGNAYPGLPTERLATVQQLTIPRGDGSSLQAFLTHANIASKPDGEPPPLVILPHGGIDEWADGAFNLLHQAWALAGFNVLQVTVRGGRGQGFAHRDAGFDAFGRGMVDDLLLAARYAFDHGMGNESATCTAGLGFGGHTALMAAIQAPGSISCVIAIDAMTDPGEHLRAFGVDGYSAPEDWRLRQVGMTHRSSAPDASLSIPRQANQIASSVLLIHANENARILPSQSVRLHRELRKGGRSQFIELQGTGFDLSKRNRHRVVLETTAFLVKQLALR